ncbi:hypothetical protein CEQ36_03765 [Yersinia intermedia]|nr:hypothetical protein A6J67_14150 [Yersinia sp. FDAARGOS_228]AVL34830.1 hypothetical protein CEQ36_03765 [Yersinia intermedia]
MLRSYERKSKTTGKKKASTRAGLKNTGSNVSNVVLSCLKPEAIGLILKSKMMIMVLNSTCKHFVENFSHSHTNSDGIMFTYRVKYGYHRQLPSQLPTV